MGCKKFKLKLKKYKQKHFQKRIDVDVNDRHLPGAQEVYRFLESKILSHCFIKAKYINKLNDFSEVREVCFDYLQKVIYDNCMCSYYPVNKQHISNLSVELEQYALLASLEARKYQKSISKIINEIEKSTQRKEVHEDIKNLLPELQNTEPFVKTEKPIENNSQIPIVSSTRTDNENQSLSRREEPLNIEVGEFESHREEVCNDCNDSQLGNCEEQSDNPKMQAEKCSVETKQVYGSEMTIDHTSSLEAVVAECSEPMLESILGTNVADSILASRNQLQESVTECLKLNEQEKTEKEKAYIAKILDDDSSDDNSFDNLSGGESESKENVDETNFLKSLEKMRELFSTDEEVAPVVSDKPKTVTKLKRPNRKPRPTIWKHEKIIQLHKFSLLASEMSYERHKRNQMMFLELFGEDSDEEHGEEYRCVETYRASCVERISRWVVKYLMPYYHNRRIIGREVFKTLAHHISETVIDKIQYPDEWTIRYFVTRFFPPRKKYVCDADVLEFQFD